MATISQKNVSRILSIKICLMKILRTQRGKQILPTNSIFSCYSIRTRTLTKRIKIFCATITPLSIKLGRESNPQRSYIWVS